LSLPLIQQAQSPVFLILSVFAIQPRRRPPINNRERKRDRESELAEVNNQIK
jgi:hypothetical protein